MKKYHVCIDPGHGPGCANQSPDGAYQEQEFAMDLALRTAAILRGQGVIVSLTRGADDYPSLSERCRVANAIPGLSLYLSLHSNAAGGLGWSKASGHLVFTSEPGEGAARNRAGKAFLRRLEEAGIHLGSKAIRHHHYTVLSDTTAPAVLLEHGFHTNRADVQQLKAADFRARLAEVDARAVLDFLGIVWKESLGEVRQCVQERFGLEEETLDYLQRYRYGTDLLRKLAVGR